MKGLVMISLFIYIFHVPFLEETGLAAAEKDDVYIVYMGAADSPNGSLKNVKSQLLSSVLKRKNALVQTYGRAISGFAARLSAAEAKTISQKPGVVSVFPDPVFQLHTTRSWDFLKYQTDVEIDSNPNADPSKASHGSDTIIGILDTGIWPESESFNDKDMGPIPSRWNGTCMEGHKFNSSNCNKKLIGARFYQGNNVDEDEFFTPRDLIGHGTHVAATAAGIAVSGASYYGLATGTAKGGSPGSRIAVYRVCSPYGCRGSSILAAFDDAIGDGVDVISVSLGTPSSVMPDFKDDPIAIGAFHAVENGITVVCSAGNDGPGLRTVVNVAPWILTVAATTIDRDFESDVVLGGNNVIKGEGINFANLSTSPVHQLIYAKLANISDAGEYAASNCFPDSMDKDKIKGKIVLCKNDDVEYTVSERKSEVQKLGGIGLILVDDKSKGVASSFKEFPMTLITSNDASDILSYINSTKNPVATILPTSVVIKYKPAPIIAYFSSRGPSPLTANILKPDIAAPGVNILAAWIGNDTEESLKGEKPPNFNLLSGTSMACPHVSGLAALVKSQYPTWSPSSIKSAIMTTAIQTNNMKAPITRQSGQVATAIDFGAGEISTTGPLQAGLVYETTNIDYLHFLCYYGYNISTIKVISKAVPANFTCPKESSFDLISNINYPSISVTNVSGKQSRSISRTVTNVAGEGTTVYSAIIDFPAQLNITVIPEKLQFMKNGEKLTYQVTVSADASSFQEMNIMVGSITWSNGEFKVRSPIVVSKE